MSAEMDSNTRIIYVRLLNEGTSVMRPTQAVHLEADVYRVLPTEGYDPEDEEWEFVPGNIVRCVPGDAGNETAMIADALISVQ